MKIEVINESLFKSAIGSGLSVYYPGILDILNSIIDWEISLFPVEWESTTDPNNPDVIAQSVEKRDYLGEIPKLSPGNVFIYNEQTIRIIDKDYIELIHTSTGALGIVRTLYQRILLEYKLKSKKSFVKVYNIPGMNKIFDKAAWVKEIKSILEETPIHEDVTVEEVSGEETDLRENGESMKLPYPISGMFLRDKQKTQDQDKFVDLVIRTFIPEIDIIPQTFVITPNGIVYYDKDLVADENHVLSEILSFISKDMENKNN